MIKYIEIENQSFFKGIKSALDKSEKSDMIIISSARIYLYKMIRVWRFIKYTV